MDNKHEMIQQSMEAQRVYLDIVRSRHHQWAYSTEDPEIKRLHLEIANRIQETMNQYYDLLNTYQSVTESASQSRSDIFTFYLAPVPSSQDA